MRLMTAVLFAVCITGCVTKARVDQRANELEVTWRTENGMPPQPPPATPPEVKEKLQVEALAQVEAEVAEERKKALEGAGQIATGNIFGGILLLLGVVSATYDGAKAARKKVA